jgi:uncharacterized delta-60 repeat protein
MKIKFIKTTFIKIALFLFSVFSKAQDGSLDTSFGNNGIVTTTIGSGDAFGRSVVIQPDGKIVVAGEFLNTGSSNDFAVIRYDINGNLDTSFGTGGIVKTIIGIDNDRGNTVALQPDGKIVVAGFSENGINYNFAMVRYDISGSLDTTFGTNGKVLTHIGTGDDFGNSLALQPDGKIVVAGRSSNGINEDFAVVRYNTNGTIDNTFGFGGKVTTEIGNSSSGQSVVLQPDGKILVAGYSFYNSTVGFAIVRYGSNGSLDSNFGNGGKVTTAIGGVGGDYGFSMALQPDGKITVAGASYNGLDNDFAIVRYNANGSLDDTFGIDGKVTTAIGTNYEYGYSVAIQPDGKTVVAGYSVIGSNRNFAIVRYDYNGNLDTTFGTGGIVTTEYGTGLGVTLQSDGKIVVAGRNNANDFAVVRYNNPSLSTKTFAQNQFRIYPNPAQTKLYIKIQEDFQIEKITILNLLGEIVLTQVVESLCEVELNIEKLSSGMYVLQVNENNKTTNNKFFKI